MEIKLLLRERRRGRGLTVVMATSHRGMSKLEAFDLEPSGRHSTGCRRRQRGRAGGG